MSVFCLWLTLTSFIVTWVCLRKLFAESKQHGGIRANNLCSPRGEDSEWGLYAESVIAHSEQEEILPLDGSWLSTENATIATLFKLLLED